MEITFDKDSYARVCAVQFARYTNGNLQCLRLFVKTFWQTAKECRAAQANAVLYNPCGNCRCDSCVSQMLCPVFPEPSALPGPCGKCTDPRNPAMPKSDLAACKWYHPKI